MKNPYAQPFASLWRAVTGRSGTTPAICGPDGGPVPGSISELAAPEINGVGRWMTIRGKSVDNPLLLILHGGPGGAGMGSFRTYLGELENDFVVINWDQYGAGKSVPKKWDESRLHLENLVADCIEITRYLLSRFGRTGLFLLGHSFGTVVGTLAVRRNPSLFTAYVGCSQVVSVARSEKMGYAFVTEKARETGNRKALAELTKISPPVNGWYENIRDLPVERKWAGEFGGLSFRKSFANEWAMHTMFTPEYRLSESFRYVKGLLKSCDRIFPETRNLDFLESCRSVEVPVHIFQGVDDRITPLSLAEEWFEILEAPEKSLVRVPEAAHLAPFENPGALVGLLRGISPKALKAAHEP